ncbi:Os06g0226200 [Oryza sativa Japonica Group]|uniref:Os06g0226200 protein n=1 Tax=Oryza sativa subsp. japonica TaxID=39947 RepID=A0A0P0WUB4_ORYSJ|nr:Os06g0226200 [Oryza sativa Japonica Group]
MPQSCVAPASEGHKLDEGTKRRPTSLPSSHPPTFAHAAANTDRFPFNPVIVLCRSALVLPVDHLHVVATTYKLFETSTVIPGEPQRACYR